MRYRFHGTSGYAVWVVLGALWLWYCMAQGYRDAYGNILGMQQVQQGYGGLYVKAPDGGYVFVGNNVLRKIPSGKMDSVLVWQ